MIGRPDFSDYVGHFTKTRQPTIKPGGGLPPISGSARDKLISILRSKTIRATTMPWTKKPAVAFTECTWGSILAHTKQYSKFGVGFKKSLLFDSDGGPAIYLRSDLYDAQHDFVSRVHPSWKGFDPNLYAFITPFNPEYASAASKAKMKLKTIVDYTHEREWRVPHDFHFELSDVEFVVLPSYESMATFPQNIKNGIGREKFILADVYSTIEKLWPVHLQ
jgi:hypothetical protein